MSVTTEPELLPPPPPPAGERGRPLRRHLVVAAAALVTVLALGGLWVNHQMNPGARGPEVDVTIPSGSSVHQIADRLAAAGVISHPLLFRIYVRIHGGVFRAGTYTVHRHDSYGDVVSELGGNAVMRRLTIPEGFTLDQIATRVGAMAGHSKAGFLAVARSGAVRSPYEPAGSNNLEGLLFPDTYLFPPDESDAGILMAMVDRFDRVAAQAGLSSAPAAVGVSPYQAVIVASMVEREAKVAADRPLVAEVVYNRLARGMRLQIDATVLYALGPGRTTITSSDLRVDSPYNTYQRTGLPPAPIATPGLAALQAALHPASGDYLYYVVVAPDGKEAFSPTLAGQEANIALARSRGLPG